MLFCISILLVIPSRTSSSSTLSILEMQLSVRDKLRGKKGLDWFICNEDDDKVDITTLEIETAIDLIASVAITGKRRPI